VRCRIAWIYQRWGADAARGLLEKIVKGALGEEAARAVRKLRRRELRKLLNLYADRIGYRYAVDAHRLAWAVAGWHAKPWYCHGSSGGWKCGKSGGKKNVERAQAFDAIRRGSK